MTKNLFFGIILSLCSLSLLIPYAYTMHKSNRIHQFNRLTSANNKSNFSHLIKKISPALYSSKRLFFINSRNNNNSETSSYFLFPFILGTMFGTYFQKTFYAEENYSKNYSINVMWINREASTDTEQRYIYPSNKDNSFGLQFLNTIVTWAKKNPGATVNVWFDSTFTTVEALENTLVLIKQEIARYQGAMAKIELKDIRLLKRVQKNPEVFSSEIPVFFRADLLRVVIAEESLRNDKNSCFIYTDFDAKPMTKSELFDTKTLHNLDTYGFVMAYNSNKLKFENSFQMFTYNETLFKAIKLMIIKANIQRVHNFLDDALEATDSKSVLNNKNVWKLHSIAFQENVFFSYPLMYIYFCQLKDLSTLMLPNSDKPYDKKRDGKEVLKIHNARFLMTRSNLISVLSKFPIPTKKVSLPPSNSAVNELLKES